MGWSFSSRLFMGGAAIASALVLQGVQSPVSPIQEMHQPEIMVRRLPAKVELTAKKGQQVAMVAYQEDESAIEIAVPMIENDLRSNNREPESIRDEIQENMSSEVPAEAVNTVRSAEPKSDSNSGPWTRNTMIDEPMIENPKVAETESPATSIEDETIVEGPLTQEAPREENVLGMLPISVPVSQGVSQKALHHITYGKSLARRGAAFAARQEFYYALQLVAQAMDTQVEGNYHNKSLSEALTALKEAEEFHAGDSESQIGMRVEMIVENHLSKVVTIEQAKSMTSIELMQAYYRFAENRMIAGGGQNAAASEAYFCLGKLHSLLSKSDRQSSRLDVAKAIVYHRASLACDQSNYRSANELGALLARNGQLEPAKRLLKQSLLIRKTPEAWKNLSIVHERLGENRFAQLAGNEYRISSMQPIMGPSASSIQWLDTKQFNDTAPIEYHDNNTERTASSAPGSSPSLPPRQAMLPAQEENGTKILNKLKRLF